MADSDPEEDSWVPKFRIDEELEYFTGLALDETERWLEVVTKREYKYPEDPRKSLENGILLCELLNTLKPGCIKKINRLPVPIAGLDNLNVFRSACKEHFGLKDAYLFDPCDLEDLSTRAIAESEDNLKYETDRRLRNVLITIHWLGKAAQQVYKGPQLDLSAFSELVGHSGSGSLAVPAHSRQSSSDSQSTPTPSQSAVNFGNYQTKLTNNGVVTTNEKVTSHNYQGSHDSSAYGSYKSDDISKQPNSHGSQGLIGHVRDNSYDSVISSSTHSHIDSVDGDNMPVPNSRHSGSLGSSPQSPSNRHSAHLDRSFGESEPTSPGRMNRSSEDYEHFRYGNQGAHNRSSSVDSLDSKGSSSHGSSKGDALPPTRFLEQRASAVAHNPTQFIKYGASEMAAAAKAQIERMEEQKQQQKKVTYEEEDWQSNLSSWKNKMRRRSAAAHQIAETDEKPAEDMSKRKSKTFKEMMEEKKRSRSINVYPYGEEEEDDFKPKPTKGLSQDTGDVFSDEVSRLTKSKSHDVDEVERRWRTVTDAHEDSKPSRKSWSWERKKSEEPEEETVAPWAESPESQLKQYNKAIEDTGRQPETTKEELITVSRSVVQESVPDTRQSSSLRRWPPSEQSNNSNNENKENGANVNRDSLYGSDVSPSGGKPQKKPASSIIAQFEQQEKSSKEAPSLQRRSLPSKKIGQDWESRFSSENQNETTKPEAQRNQHLWDTKVSETPEEKPQNSRTSPLRTFGVYAKQEEELRSPTEKYQPSPSQQFSPEDSVKKVSREKMIKITQNPDSGRGFGFSITGGKDQGLPVSVDKVTRGSAADVCELMAGDEIIAVNGAEVGNHFLDSVKVVLDQQAKMGQVELRVRRYEDDDLDDTMEEEQLLQRSLNRPTQLASVSSSEPASPGPMSPKKLVLSPKFDQPVPADFETDDEKLERQIMESLAAEEAQEREMEERHRRIQLEEAEQAQTWTPTNAPAQPSQPEKSLSREESEEPPPLPAAPPPEPNWNTFPSGAPPGADMSDLDDPDIIPDVTDPMGIPGSDSADDLETSIKVKEDILRKKSAFFGLQVEQTAEFKELEAEKEKEKKSKEMVATKPQEQKQFTPQSILKKSPDRYSWHKEDKLVEDDKSYESKHQSGQGAGYDLEEEERKIIENIERREAERQQQEPVGQLSGRDNFAISSVSDSALMNRNGDDQSGQAQKNVSLGPRGFKAFNVEEEKRRMQMWHQEQERKLQDLHEVTSQDKFQRDQDDLQRQYEEDQKRSQEAAERRKEEEEKLLQQEKEHQKELEEWRKKQQEQWEHRQREIREAQKEERRKWEEAERERQRQADEERTIRLKAEAERERQRRKEEAERERQRREEEAERERKRREEAERERQRQEELEQERLRYEEMERQRLQEEAEEEHRQREAARERRRQEEVEREKRQRAEMERLQQEMDPRDWERRRDDDIKRDSQALDALTRQLFPQYQGENNTSSHNGDWRTPGSQNPPRNTNEDERWRKWEAEGIEATERQLRELQEKLMREKYGEKSQPEIERKQPDSHQYSSTDIRYNHASPMPSEDYLYPKPAQPDEHAKDSIVDAVNKQMMSKWDTQPDNSHKSQKKAPPPIAKKPLVIKRDEAPVAKPNKRNSGDFTGADPYRQVGRPEDSIIVDKTAAVLRRPPSSSHDDPSRRHSYAIGSQPSSQPPPYHKLVPPREENMNHSFDDLSRPITRDDVLAVNKKISFMRESSPDKVPYRPTDITTIQHIQPMSKKERRSLAALPQTKQRSEKSWIVPEDERRKTEEPVRKPRRSEIMRKHIDHPSQHWLVEEAERRRVAEYTGANRAQTMPERLSNQPSDGAIGYYGQQPLPHDHARSSSYSVRSMPNEFSLQNVGPSRGRSSSDLRSTTDYYSSQPPSGDIMHSRSAPSLHDRLSPSRGRTPPNTESNHPYSPSNSSYPSSSSNNPAYYSGAGPKPYSPPHQQQTGPYNRVSPDRYDRSPDRYLSPGRDHSRQQQDSMHPSQSYSHHNAPYTSQGYGQDHGHSSPVKPPRMFVSEAGPSHAEQMVVSGKEKCSHCDEDLGHGAAMVIDSLGLYYHVQCFHCCVCHMPLGSGQSGADVRVHVSKLHCYNCYSNDEVGLKYSKV